MENEISELIKINKENNKYLLVIKSNSEIMTLTITDNEKVGGLSYSKKLNLKEIKELHTAFLGLNSCKEFSEFLKNLSELKKLSITEKENKLSINFEVEHLLKKKNIEIILEQEKINFELTIRELCKEINLIKEEMKNKNDENKKLESENKELKKDIENLKNENIKLKEEMEKIKNILDPINKKFLYKKSVIMKENEFDFICSAIKSVMNKEVKKIKKLYQATVDGSDPINFHSKCDNIPNTLTLIKSAGNRRFGGFTTQTWDKTGYKSDEYSFLFSLDKQKIYKCTKNRYAIWTGKNYGPIFGQNLETIIGDTHDLLVQGMGAHTTEFWPNHAYDYSGDNDALSETGSVQKDISLEEYEVFQVIF